MYNMDTHIHSEYSPDSKAKLEDIFKVAKNRNLDIIAISDHNTVDGSKEAQRLTKNDDLLVIPSLEISSLEGHILGFGCQENIKRDLPATPLKSQPHRLPTLPAQVTTKPIGTCSAATKRCPLL